MTTPYPKIKSMFARDATVNNRWYDESEYATPEIGYLAWSDWLWTEKVDGTSIRIIYDNGRLSIRGRRDVSQIPPRLHDHLSVLAQERLGNMISNFGDSIYTLYGEGFGVGIQGNTGKGYIPDGNAFCLFDVKVTYPDGKELWLQYSDVELIGITLDLLTAPVVGSGDLFKAYQFCRDGFLTRVSQNNDITPYAEGLVARPVVDMRDRLGHRIITKIRSKDIRPRD